MRRVILVVASVIFLALALIIYFARLPNNFSAVQGYVSADEQTLLTTSSTHAAENIQLRDVMLSGISYDDAVLKLQAALPESAGWRWYGFPFMDTTKKTYRIGKGGDIISLAPGPNADTVALTESRELNYIQTQWIRLTKHDGGARASVAIP